MKTTKSLCNSVRFILIFAQYILMTSLALSEDDNFVWAEGSKDNIVWTEDSKVLWTSISLANAKGTHLDSQSLPHIKVGPALQMESLNGWEQSKWFAQLLVNPSEASKRRKFHVYNLQAMSETDIEQLAKSINLLKINGAPSPRVAFLGEDPKSSDDFIAVSAKWNGDLLWTIASTAGVTNAEEFWSKSNLPNNSLPTWASYDFYEEKNISFKHVTTTIFDFTSESQLKCQECYFNDDSVGKTLKINKVDFKKFGSVANLIPTATPLPYIAFDKRFQELEDYYISSLVNKPIKLTDEISISWPEDQN